MSGKNTIRAIILDIGNVLVDFQYQEYFKRFVSSQEELDRLIQATVHSSDWGELDRGVLKEEEVLDLFIENDPEIEGVLRMMYSNMDGVIKMREFAIPFIEEMKERGYEVIALSNISDKMIRECSRDLIFLEHMTGAILSYEEKCIKPDSEIYENLLKKYHLKGEECVFIDDLLENTKQASKIGFHTITYGSYEQVREELEEVLAK